MKLRIVICSAPRSTSRSSRRRTCNHLFPAESAQTEPPPPPSRSDLVLWHESGEPSCTGYVRSSRLSGYLCRSLNSTRVNSIVGGMIGCSSGKEMVQISTCSTAHEYLFPGHELISVEGFRSWPRPCVLRFRGRTGIGARQEASPRRALFCAEHNGG